MGYVHGGKYQFDQTYNVAHQLAAGGEVQAQVSKRTLDLTRFLMHAWPEKREEARGGEMF